MARQDQANDEFSLTSFLYGGNADYLEQLQAAYEDDPQSVDPEWRDFFGALKDVTRFLPAGGKARDLKRVVWWQFGGARLIGFVTEEHVNPRLFGAEAADMVAVYFPMSYQIGGYTLYLHKDQLQETDLSVEEAMRLVLIGGVTSHDTSSNAPRE